jgi:hypothetical protein
MRMITTHPAMVSREITEQTANGFVIVEIWNKKHPECPFHFFDHDDRPPQFQEIYTGAGAVKK